MRFATVRFAIVGSRGHRAWRNKVIHRRQPWGERMEYALLSPLSYWSGRGGGIVFWAYVINTKAACAGTFVTIAAAGRRWDPAGRCRWRRGRCGASSLGRPRRGSRPGLRMPRCAVRRRGPSTPPCEARGPIPITTTMASPGVEQSLPPGSHGGRRQPAILENSGTASNPTFTPMAKSLRARLSRHRRSDFVYPTAPMAASSRSAIRALGIPIHNTSGMAVAKQAKAAYGDNLTITGIRWRRPGTASPGHQYPAVVFQSGGCPPEHRDSLRRQSTDRRRGCDDGLIRNYVVNA